MFNLAFLIPLFPLLAFLLIVLFLNRNNRVSALTAVAGIFLSGVFSYGVLFEAIGKGGELAKKPFYQPLPGFFGFLTGKDSFTVGVMIDPLAAVVLFMVTTICLMIFIYSIGYMQHTHTDEHGHHHTTDDPRYARFFAYISLFASAMLGLVISSNLIELFIFWEIMGLCSFLLIGFWSTKLPHEHHIDVAQSVSYYARRRFDLLYRHRVPLHRFRRFEFSGDLYRKKFASSRRSATVWHARCDAHRVVDFGRHDW